MKRTTANNIPVDTSELDQEFVADTFQPLSAADKARWERAKRKGKSPKKRRTIPAVTVEIEPTLLSQINALAKKMHVSRDRLIARGLKAMLASAED